MRSNTLAFLLSFLSSTSQLYPWSHKTLSLEGENQWYAHKNVATKGNISNIISWDLKNVTVISVKDKHLTPNLFKVCVCVCACVCVCVDRHAGGGVTFRINPPETTCDSIIIIFFIVKLKGDTGGTVFADVVAPWFTAMHYLDWSLVTEPVVYTMKSYGLPFWGVRINLVTELAISAGEWPVELT